MTNIQDGATAPLPDALSSATTSHHPRRRPPPSGVPPPVPSKDNKPSTSLAPVVHRAISPYKGRDMTDPANLYPYYTKLINNAFRKLQLDPELTTKSLVDLMDYCELLYEQLRNQNNPGYYIDGFVILNYFINSYVMMNYKGFDQLIATSEVDFVLYLNLFLFYINHAEILVNDSMGYPAIAPLQLRTLVLQYLVDHNLLHFDVNELYTWLYDYIDYLHRKDVQVSREQSVRPHQERTIADNEDDDNNAENDDDDDSFTIKFPPLKATVVESAYPRNSLSDPQVSDSESSDSESHSDDSKSSWNAPVPKKSVPYPLDITEEETNITPYVNESPVLPRVTTEPTFPIVPEQKVLRTSTEPILSLSERPPQVIPPIPKVKVQYSRSPVAPPGSGSNSNGENRNPFNKAQPNPRMQQPQWPQQYTNQVQNPNYQVPPPQFPPPQPQQYLPPQQFPPQQQFPPIQYAQGPGYGQPPMQQQTIPYANGNGDPNSNPFTTYGICGLKNFGSNCYINLTLQVIYGLYYFRNLMQSLDISRMPKSLTAATSGLLGVFVRHGNSNIAPTKFLRTVQHLKPGFNVPYEQQDAQEFLIFVLDQLHNECRFKPLNAPVVDLPTLTNKKDKEEYAKWYADLVKFEGLSAVHDLFQGHLQNKLICYKCQYESVSYSSFTILSLPIPSSGSLVNLADCLMYYTQDEVLKGENAWKCPKCSNVVDPMEGHRLDNNPVFYTKKSGIFKFKRSKSPSKEPTPPVKLLSSAPDQISLKRLTFIKLPKILFIHLSRFSNMHDKLTVPISYPLRLNFSHDAEPVSYHLVGVINHYGSLKSGHYTSIVNKMLDDKFHQQQQGNAKVQGPSQGWYLFDDEHITHIKMGDNESVHSRDAYVLCYERL